MSSYRNNGYLHRSHIYLVLALFSFRSRYWDVSCEKLTSAVEMFCRHLLSPFGTRNFKKYGHSVHKFLDSVAAEVDLDEDIIESLRVCVAIISYSDGKNGQKDRGFNGYKYPDEKRGGKWPHELVTERATRSIFEEVVPVLIKLLNEYFSDKQ